MATRHIPVLSDEVVAMLNLHKGAVVVDATLGGGGHTRALLSRVLPGGRVVAFDADQEAIGRFLHATEDDEALRHALERKDCILVRENFSHIEETLRALGHSRVDAILADFGFSSDQVEDADRGFSFLADGPLDMRLDRTHGKTAADIVNDYDEAALARIISRYGDEPKAGQIARAIVARRGVRKFERTTDLAECVKSVFSGPQLRRMKLHPATRTFQAIRIETNDELGVIERFLRSAVSMLAPSGRIAVITFHSGEDALVKKVFANMAAGCVCPPAFPQCRCGITPELRVLSPRFVRPSEEEVKRNPRSRSARLRGAEKIGG